MENKKPKILHFENDPYLQKIFKDLFMRNGFDYKAFGEYKKHLDIIVKEDPDLLIMTIVMPDIDGFEAIKMLKTDERTKDIPFVILTNLGQEEEVKKGLETGALKYLLMQHYTPNDLVEEIKKILKTIKTNKSMKEKIKKTIQYGYKFPRLTKEEFEFFKIKDKDWFKKYNLNRSLKRKISLSLQELAVKKLVGYAGFRKNKKEAISHHLKACQYDPYLVCNRPNFRKEAGFDNIWNVREIIMKEKIKKIKNDLNQYKPEIIKYLSQHNWQHFDYYFKIRKKIKENNLDNEFKRDFCYFYAMNGMRGLKDKQKDEFFKLVKLRENNLEKILEALHEIPGYSKKQKLFLSFGTKLLHTINEKLPIYDGNIAHVLELPAQIYPVSLEERIKNRIDIYEELKNRFNVLLANTEIRYYLKGIRQELRSKARLDKFNWQDKYISDTKLLDSLLWALYSILK